MARDFDGASDYLLLSSLTSPSYPVTISCWIYGDTDPGAHRVAVSFGRTGGTNYYGVTLGVNWAGAGNPVRLAAADNSATSTLETTAGISTGTWAHACGITVSATERYVYLNGTNGAGSAAETSRNWISGIDRFSVGARYQIGALGLYFDGKVAEVAVWNAQLTTDEIGSLAAGYSPLMVRPGSLWGYWPLFGRAGAAGDEESWVNTYTLAQTHSPALYDHPRIIYPRRRTIILPASATGTSVALSGLAATGAVGSLSKTASKALTGLAATGAVGTLTPKASVTLTGAAATGAVGDLEPSAAGAVALSGLEATGAVGLLAPAVNITLTGLAATGAVGSLTPTAGYVVALSGLEATGEVGAFAPSAAVALAGLEATGAVGDLVVSSGAVSIELTGLEATGAVGDFSVSVFGDTEKIALILKILLNKQITDPATGLLTIYDDDDTTPLYQANVYEDAAGTTPYRGQGIEHRGRLQ